MRVAEKRSFWHYEKVSSREDYFWTTLTGDRTGRDHSYHVFSCHASATESSGILLTPSGSSRGFAGGKICERTCESQSWKL